LFSIGKEKVPAETKSSVFEYPESLYLNPKCMRKIRVLTTLGYIFLLFIHFSKQEAIAQNSGSPPARFELKSGDRVTFVGNALIEDDMSYGYLELALTTRFPQSNVTFRNVGWSGDNVWGEARSYISQPPTAYELLIENITKFQPTVVFVAYGGVEAQDGAGGLARFNEGYNKLLDKIDAIGARSILVSPIPVISGDLPSNLTTRNADLELYSAAIAKIAAARGKKFIDIFTPIQDISKKINITTDGVHLNETGYYYLTKSLEKGLGLKDTAESVHITVSKTGANTTAPAKMLVPENGGSVIRFKIDESLLPLPVPAGITEGRKVVKISGLKKGFYTLSADDSEIITASAKQWAEGVDVKLGASSYQVKALRDMILRKNEVFFSQYRPQNRTYILGMRAYEQGRHSKGLDELGLIVKWLEGQIALNRMPLPHIYSLTETK
jgi:lysophospholipase L1-like esterase